MILDYIEIGTSDFDTLVQNTDLTGLSIDPLKIYLDALPNKVNNIKINAAISDFDGFKTAYKMQCRFLKQQMKCAKIFF